MRSDDQTATFTRDGKPAAVKSLVLIVFFGPIGVFAGDVVASTLGTSVVAGQVLAAVAPTVLIAGLGYSIGGRGTVVFEDDGVRLQDQRVRYDEVTVALRGESMFGTATFKLVVLGGTNLTLRYVNDPDGVARLLAQNLTVPADQLARAPADHDDTSGSASRRMEEGWLFWDYWQAEEPLPKTALVDIDYLKDVMEVSALEPNRIDSVDMRDATGLSDIDKNDVTSSSTSDHP